MHRQNPGVPADQFHRWGVILAGGDGKRLLPLTRSLTGDDRPKQFCALTGGETLLSQTRRRTAPLIPPQQTMLLLTEAHHRYYRDQIADVPAACRLIQPYNHGTAPAIAYSLTRLNRLDSEALVAFFPSDHHFTSDSAFARYIEFAFSEASARPDRVILLGVEADAPEEAYGWIEPGLPIGESEGKSIFDVGRFWEKPSRAMAHRLMREGCLWNSFVMIGKVEAFLNLMRRTLPELIEAMESMWDTAMLNTRPGMDTRALATVYRKVPATNFSSDVLAAQPSRLAVVRAEGLGWSDLGEPRRVFSVLRAGNGAGEIEKWSGAALELIA